MRAVFVLASLLTTAVFAEGIDASITFSNSQGTTFRVEGNDTVGGVNIGVKDGTVSASGSILKSISGAGNPGATESLPIRRASPSASSNALTPSDEFFKSTPKPQEPKPNRRWSSDTQ